MDLWVLVAREVGGVRVLELGFNTVFALIVSCAQSLPFVESKILPLYMPFFVLVETRRYVSNPCRLTIGEHLHVVGLLDHRILVEHISGVNL